MNKTTLIGVGIAAAAIVAAVLFSLQNFDAGKVSCENIDAARAELRASYETGVDASVQVFAEEKAAADEALHQCLSAEPKDPCAAEQKARDAAVSGFNDIASPSDSAPYAEFQKYFAKRDDAYAKYRTAKDSLDACRMANPPKPEVPYEKSDTKACFDAYDASVEASRATFDKNTQAMRAALNAGLAALDAREKACHPPEDGKKFTKLADDGAADIRSCRLLDPSVDLELFVLKKRAAAIPSEINAVDTSIENANKRSGTLRRDLSEVDTYIPPESAKTQFEGALNALRAERKVSIESALDYYRSLIARKQAEKAALLKELADVEAQIAAREAEIAKENAERQSKFPTALHLSNPDACAYYHCHGVICGIPDPEPHGCGQGATTEDDVNCKAFFDAYLKAAGS